MSDRQAERELQHHSQAELALKIPKAPRTPIVYPWDSNYHTITLRVICIYTYAIKLHGAFGTAKINYHGIQLHGP